jgi:phosphoglucosamine mutase
MKKTGKTLSELADSMRSYPQTLINVKVSDLGKVRFPRDEEIKKAIKVAEDELREDGRVLVRVSGTEPLVRVMIEGKDEDKINILAQDIARVIKERLL